MSVRIAQNTAGLLTVPDFFSPAAGTPITVCVSLKLVSLPTAGFNALNLVRADGGTGYLTAGVANNGAASHQARAETNNGASSSTATLEKFGSMSGVWTTMVFVFASDTVKYVYSLNASGDLITSPLGATNRPAVGDVNLKLLGTWANSEYFVSGMKIFRSAFNSTQAAEYLAAGTIAGVSAYADWDMVTPWSTSIPDISGNSRNLTPPATWLYSADNPNFNTTPNTAPSITGVNFAGFEYLITATDADGDTVTYSTSSPPSHGSLTRVSGAHTYVPDGTFSGADAFTVAGSDGISQAYSTMTVTAAGAEDTAPDPFTFGSIDNAPVGEIIYAASPVVLSGMTPNVDSLAVPSGGLNYRFKPAGGVFGDWLAVSSNVQNGAEIEASLLSSSGYEQQKVGTLTIGGVAGTFTVTTEAEAVEPVGGDNATTPKGSRITGYYLTGSRI